jgi:DNA repair protein RadC
MATASLTRHPDPATRARLREDRTIYRAFDILGKRIKAAPISLSNPGEVRQYLTLAYANEDREVFSVLWLDAKNCLIEFEPLSFGTLTQASVYPREVARAALRQNAAAVILAHNHPSGNSEPSNADRTLTAQLKTTLALVDVRVLDHLIVAGNKTLSFVERGLL